MISRVGLSLIIGLSLLSVTTPAFAADDGVSIEALVDKATALVGDRVRLTVDVTYKRGTEIKFTEFKENKIGDFEIKDSGRDLKKGLLGQDESKLWYYIASYSIGKRQIPPLEIKYRVKGAKAWESMRTRALNVTIESSLPQGKSPTDIKDVKGPVAYFEINWLLVCGAAILLISIALIIIFKLRKRPLPVRLPHETALEELEAIRGNFLRNSDVKEYYAGVSDCIRRYIERSFKLKAPEMTTEEFLGLLGGSMVLSPGQKDLLKDFLNACDMVKFAKYTPAKGEMETVFLAAKKFVEETKERFMPKTPQER